MSYPHSGTAAVSFQGSRLTITVNMCLYAEQPVVWFELRQHLEKSKSSPVRGSKFKPYQSVRSLISYFRSDGPISRGEPAVSFSLWDFNTKSRKTGSREDLLLSSDTPPPPSPPQPLSLEQSSSKNAHSAVMWADVAAQRFFIGPITLQLNMCNLSARPKVTARQYISVPPLYCPSVIALLVA